MSTTPTIAHAHRGPTFTALCGSSSLVGKEGYAVKMHTDGTIILATTQGERHLGVLVTGAAVGQPVVVSLPGCETVAIVDEAVTNAFTELTNAVTTGKFENAASGDWVTAWAQQSAGADGDMIKVITVGPYIK